MTRLCVPIYVRSPEQATRDALVAVEHGAEIVELRLDALPDEALESDTSPEFEQILNLLKRLRETNIRVILTLRPRKEGGKSDLDDGARFDRLAQLAVREGTWVDLEWRPMSRAGGWPLAFLDLAAGGEVRTITSAHDFETRPDDLLNVFAEMSQSRADVAKLAWRARSVRDNIEAFELLREAAKPSIAICMGEAGLPSRVLARKFNAYLTFASLGEGNSTADGQVPIDDLKNVYRWDAIKRSTQVFGVVGHPVSHSKSPHVHNANFSAIGYDGVYVPLLVSPSYEAFKAFMETWLRFEPLDMRGLSVTLPHKEHALRYGREVDAEIDPLVEQIGAANTVTIQYEDGEPKLRLSNTDAEAMTTTVSEALQQNDLSGLSIGILGAGGTGRTATAAFKHLGCSVTLYNRTVAKAQDLGREFDANAAPLSDLGKTPHDVLLNATSVGMTPDVETSPLVDPAKAFNSTRLAFDTIYTPASTKFLQQADAAGIATVNGQQMFLHQAGAQARLWTSQEPNLEAMQAAFDQAG